eukprot:968615-Amphidinium_carterae.1
MRQEPLNGFPSASAWLKSMCPGNIEQHLKLMRTYDQLRAEVLMLLERSQTTIGANPRAPEVAAGDDPMDTSALYHGKMAKQKAKVIGNERQVSRRAVTVNQGPHRRPQEEPRTKTLCATAAAEKGTRGKGKHGKESQTKEDPVSAGAVDIGHL